MDPKGLCSNMDSSISMAASMIKEATALIVLTGAGFSADSGLSTYTGSQRKTNLWINAEHEDLFAMHSTTYASMASPDILSEDAALAWGFHSSMVKAYAAAEPHEGYAIINR